MIDSYIKNRLIVHGIGNESSVSVKIYIFILFWVGKSWMEFLFVI